jgi:AraC-like DNA-binding protein
LRAVICHDLGIVAGVELRYSILLGRHALAAVHTALVGHGTIDVIPNASQLLAELAFPRDECVVLDPALVSPAEAESIATSIAAIPRALVAYSSVTASALQSAVVLAQRTSARFVFHGMPNERSALQRALLLTPSSELGSALLDAIDSHLNRLPQGLRDRVELMFSGGDGPSSPDALAAASSITRRALDRRISDAGFLSARAVVEAARVAWAYRAITNSVVPLGRIAATLGYTSSRTMDQQLRRLIDVTSSKLRKQPLSSLEVTNRLAHHLIVPDGARHSRRERVRTAEDIKASFKVISGGARSRRGGRIISNGTGINL